MQGSWLEIISRDSILTKLQECLENGSVQKELTVKNMHLSKEH